jgi:rubrerythrin
VTVSLNSVAVFEIAERIERNGAAFYRRAAEMFEAPGASKILLDLAAWENRHEQTFARMRAQLPKQPARPDTNGKEQTLPESQVLAGLAVFGIRSEPADNLYGDESEADILRMAIQKEKDSIVFYHGLKDFVQDKAGKDQIDRIIKEEMRHVVTLDGLLNERKQPNR